MMCEDLTSNEIALPERISAYPAKTENEVGVDSFWML
jgi:hypothetical protein